jgi:hypothetical protein
MRRLKSPRRSAVRYGGEPCRLWDSSAPGAASAAALNTGRKYIACACNILYVGVTLRVSSAVPALPVFRWTGAGGNTRTLAKLWAKQIPSGVYRRDVTVAVS